MSYYTQYTLTWDTPKPDVDQMVNAVAPLLLEEGEAITPTQLELVRSIITGADTAKWYNSDHQFAELSKQWPNTVFSMRCKGEDGDQWVTYFQNGRALTEAIIEPEFDPDRFDQHAIVPKPTPTV